MLFEYISKFDYGTKNMNYNYVLFNYMLILKRIFKMLCYIIYLPSIEIKNENFTLIKIGTVITDIVLTQF